MYTQTNIVEKLNFFDIACDIEEVTKLIKMLHLEPIYEDENGELYYDADAYECIKANLELKKSQQEAKEVEIVENEQQTGTALQLDASSKNVKMLIKNISLQVTEDLSRYIRNNNILEEAFNSGALKRDNEILAKRLQETINENKKLIEKIRQLEMEVNSFHPLLGNMYMKNK